MNYKFIYSFSLLIFFNLSAISQDRIKAGKVYQPGEKFTGPLVGIEMTVPSHWKGYLPQDNEIFIMQNDTSVSANCMYFVSESTIQKIEARWNSGFELAPGLVIITDSEITSKNGILSAEIKVTNNPQNRGMVLAKCGPYGYCVSVMMYTAAQFFEPYRNNLNSLLDNLTFVKPIPRSELDEMDWRKELTGKYLFAYEREQGSKKESQVWLNLDGSFKSKISRTGMFKGSAGKYKGKKKGSYLIYNKDKGQSAKLVLLYNNLPEVTLPLEKIDKQYYINGQVFYYSAQ